jgi:hypothetical protein
LRGARREAAENLIAGLIPGGDKKDLGTGTPWLGAGVRGTFGLLRVIGIDCLSDVFTGSGRDYRGGLGVVLVGLGVRLLAL